MMKKTAFFCIFLIIILSGCNSNPPLVSKDDISTQVIEYFKTRHHKEIIVQNVERVQTDTKSYYNIVHVSDSINTYELFLGKNNEPLFDNVKEADLKNKYDSDDSVEKCFAQCTLSKSLIKSELYVKKLFLSEKYQLLYFVQVDQIPKKDDIDSIYKFLQDLYVLDIDGFAISICSPEFLNENTSNHISHGYQLAAILFDTSMQKQEFYTKFQTFVEGVFWDEDAFNHAKTELEKLGYNDVFFNISFHSSDEIIVNIHVSSYNNQKKENVDSIIDRLYPDAFFVNGKTISYQFCVDN